MTQLALLLAVDPVPWARAQMAFTLAVHIVLVPLGVAWAFLALVAERRAISRHDPDARLLAERWSKYMAVTFAVGAVTGTVLSFEFGLLWPRLMGRFGAAFGIPFAVEGLFFFVEAIFIAVYIYGWKRLEPRRHFWTGVPVVVAGIGGTASVVAANAWMNEPAGFTLNAAGQVVRVDPWAVYFNRAMPLQTLHMLVAAYLVAGFLVSSVYAATLVRGRRDHYRRVGFAIAFTVAAVAAPLQLVVGDTLARDVFRHEPVKFAAIEVLPHGRAHAPETILGWLDRDGRVVGGLSIPGLASWLADPGSGTATRVVGLDAVPASQRPTNGEVTVVHLAWDLMVGIGTALSALAVWYAIAWVRRRELPRSRAFWYAAAAAGVASVVALEAGWVVTEVGRQPWVVHGHLTVTQAATRNQGVWLTFAVVTALYAGLAVTLVLVLRQMSRRFAAGEEDLSGGPYSPGAGPPGALVGGGSAR
jgi:cytochrome d ubiquinol oxidase subunit I